jgi:PAS domain S-box-containing protein
MLIAYAPLSTPGWSLVLVTTSEVWMAQAEKLANGVWGSAERSIRTTLLLILAVSLVGLVGLPLMLDRMVSRRVTALTAGVQAITAGNLEVQLPTGSQDELGMLSQAFNQMAGELKQRNDSLTQAYAELSLSETKYKSLFESVPLPVLVYSPESLSVLDANQASCEHYGYTRQEFLKMTVKELHPAEQGHALSDYVAIMGVGSPANRSWQHQKKDGTLIDVEITSHSLSIAGQPAQLSVIYDVTDKLKMERALHEREEVLEQRVEERTQEISRLHAHSEQRNRELEMLYRADGQLYRHLHLDQVMQALVDVAVDLLGADKASVQVWDDRRKRLEVRAWRNYSAEMLQLLQDFKPGDGIAGYVFRSGEALTVEDARHAPPPADYIAAREGISSVLSMPISIGGQVYGVFRMDYCQPRSFSANDMRLFNALAQRAAIAIDNARLYEQAEQAATLEERQRLARELHDALTQSLYSLVLLSEAGRRYASAGNLDQVEHHLRRLGETSHQALKEMRLLVYELRPMILQEVGLEGALRQRLDAVEKRAGIKTALLIEGQLDLPAKLDDELYRIVQESLNNSLKHAHASMVSVKIQRLPDLVKLEVSDNGVGFDPASLESGGIGLQSMRERAERLGGKLEINSASSNGASLRVLIPLASPLPVAVNAEEGKL